MRTTNPNIELISLENLCDILAEEERDHSPYKLLSQSDCDESLMSARVSVLQQDSTRIGLVQVEGSAALIKQYRPDHVKLAVWMIEEELKAA